MDRRKGIAEKHDVGSGSLRSIAPPMAITHQHKIDPFGIIRKQLRAIQIVMEYFFQIPPRRAIVHVLEPGSGPRLFVAFDDESARLLIEFVRVCGEYTCVVFAESQRKPMEEM